jgi:hypothetical protein
LSVQAKRVKAHSEEPKARRDIGKLLLNAYAF